jgi:Subtilase family
MRRSKPQEGRRLAAAGAVLLASFLLSACGVEPTASDQDTRAARSRGFQVSPALLIDLQRNGVAHAIVNLRDPGHGFDRRARIASAQRMLNGLAPHVVRRRAYTNLSAVAVDLTPEGLELLEARAPTIASITRDEETRPQLAESVPLLHASAVHAAGLTGSGVLVGIVDTGVDANHPDLAGRVVAQHCFTHGACARGVADGPDEGDLAFDDVGHGTNVTAIVVSQGNVASTGFAPGAQAVVIRALSRQGGFVSDWVAALDWLVEHHDQYPVQLVNLSLGTDGTHEGDCDVEQPAVASALGELGALGVLVLAASGNGGSATSLPSPACNSGALAVGATYDADLGRFPPSPANYADLFGEGFAACHDGPASVGTVACFTNSSPRLGLLAPGAVIAAAAPTDLVAAGIAAGVGTSQATATATGVAAIVLEARPSLGPSDIAAVLGASGQAVTDPKNGLSFPLIDAQRAVRLAECFGLADGATCDDAEPCTTGDACLSGSCMGSPIADGTACDDGNACNLNTVCAEGACGASATRTCPIATACQEPPSCRIGDGACFSSPAFDGASCDDGDACTTDDTCTSGVCRGRPRSCPLAAACLIAKGCAKGNCSYEPGPDGADCSGGTCLRGKCVPRVPSPSEAAGSSGDNGCSCRTAATDSGAALAWSSLLLFSVVLARRTSRPKREQLSQRHPRDTNSDQPRQGAVNHRDQRDPGDDCRGRGDRRPRPRARESLDRGEAQAVKGALRRR